MVDFLGQEEETKPFLGGAQAVEPQPLQPTTTEVLASYYSIALDKGVETARQEVSAGLFPMLKMEANSKASGLRTTAIDRIIEEAPDPATAAADIRREVGGLMFADFANPDVQILVGDGDFSDRERRQIDRLVSAERIIANRQEMAGRGFWAGAGYFVDTAISSVVHNVVGAQAELTGLGDLTFEGAGQLKDLAREAADLLNTDMTPEEFEIQFNGIIDRVTDAGLFSDTNPYYLGTFLEMVREEGRGFTSALERTFQAVDVVTLGLSAAVKGVGTASETPRVVTRLKGREDAVSGLVEAVDKGIPSPATAEAVPSAIRPARADDWYFAGPELRAMREAEANNSALHAVKKYNWGAYADPKKVEQAVAGWKKSIREQLKHYRRHEMDMDYRVDSFGNIFGQVYFGKRGTAAGEPYKTAQSAQKFADKIGGEVIETIDAGITKYQVVKEWAVPTKGLADATDMAQINTSFLANHLSTTSRTTNELDAILKQGEAIGSRVVKELGREYKKVRSKVGKTEATVVDKILRDLRDNPLENWRREALTDNEFIDMYRTRTGKAPSKETVDYWQAIQELNDVDYYMNADAILKDAYNNGEEMLKVGNDWVRAKPVRVDNDELIYYNGKMTPKDSLPEEMTVWQIKDDYQPGSTAPIRYMAFDKPTTRRLYHTDVMAYNVGGHRRYKDTLRFFIKQEGETTLMSGKTVPRGPKTFMGVRLESEARQAVEEFNTIVRAVDSGIRGPELDDIIRANNNWNNAIEDLADWDDFLSRHGLDNTEVNFAFDGEDLNGTLKWAGEQNVGDVFRNGWNNKARSDQPLIGFGGDELDTLDPTTITERTFASTVNRHAEKNYAYRAVNGWLKAANDAGIIKNADEISAMSPKQALYNAVVRPGTKEATAFENERRTIQFALSNPNKAIEQERRIMEAAADVVYGAGWRKTANFLDQADPIGWTRSLAFNTKLGLFAWDQLYVQASQLINAFGISSATIGPHGAMQGMLGVVPMRLALVGNIPDGALARIASIQSTFTGLSADEFVKLRDWIKGTGRNIVDRTVIEENRGLALLGDNRILDAGQVFFKEGELYARLGALTMNALERKKMFGTLDDIFDDNVTREMIRRQDILAGNMTSASAAQWQRGALSVPLQFMTYAIRMNEQIFTNRILNPQERFTLGMTHLMAYGAAAVPTAGYLMDKFQFNQGVPEESQRVFTLLRYGGMDAILSYTFDNETAMSGRLGVGEGLFDFFATSSEETVWDIAAGPGGGIAIDIWKAMSSMSKNLGQGNVNVLEADVNRLARIATSYSRAQQAWFAMKYNKVVSRNSEATLFETDGTDALLLALGIPLAEQREMWTLYKFDRSNKEKLDKHIGELQRMARIAKRALDDDDIDGFTETMDDIGVFLAILDPWEKRKAMQRLRDDGVLIDGLIRNLRRRGKGDLADRMEERINDTGS